MKKDLKFIKQMVWISIVVITGLLLTITIILFVYSPGKPEPFMDIQGGNLKGSISEKKFLLIGGIRQGMFIQSKNEGNPVLLYLHGGIPDYFLTHKYPTGLEEYFTVVWWDQRGSGLSYNTDIPEDSKNLDQFLSDTKEVTNYLRARFGQEKIYLMGRSGGTFIGIQMAAKSPELYHAYIGIAQMSDQFKSEKLAYDYILKQFKTAGNMKMVRKLEASPVTDQIPNGYLKIRDMAMHSLGIGTTRDMNSIITGLFIPSLTFKGYTLKEKFNLWKGKSESGVHPLWETILITDLSKKTNKLDIPVYFFHGKYDYTVSYDLAKMYFEEIEAPKKRFYSFENSAHSPHFEEPKRVKDIFLNEIINEK